MENAHDILLSSASTRTVRSYGSLKMIDETTVQISTRTLVVQDTAVPDTSPFNVVLPPPVFVARDMSEDEIQQRRQFRFGMAA